MAATRKQRSNTRSTVRIGPLHGQDLSKFGYSHIKTMSVVSRHAALTKAVAAYGSLSVFRKLNAVYVLTRRTAPSSSTLFKKDRDWVKSHFGFNA